MQGPARGWSGTLVFRERALLCQVHNPVDELPQVRQAFHVQEYLSQVQLHATNLLLVQIKDRRRRFSFWRSVLPTLCPAKTARQIHPTVTTGFSRVLQSRRVQRSLYLRKSQLRKEPRSVRVPLFCGQNGKPLCDHRVKRMADSVVFVCTECKDLLSGHGIACIENELYCAQCAQSWKLCPGCGRLAMFKGTCRKCEYGVPTCASCKAKIDGCFFGFYKIYCHVCKPPKPTAFASGVRASDPPPKCQNRNVCQGNCTCADPTRSILFS